ncbi:MAG TPA: type II secretion system protein GspM, partial [Rhodanobacteraceae bacterium]|nr:type II secretion system protein GspM [Rhodanobacteraceae bacterium]
ALADATARSSGLESALRRVEPVGASGVRVSFEVANFDALIGWIETLAHDYGIEATDFSADRADGVGLVNARVTLQDVP